MKMKKMFLACALAGLGMSGSLQAKVTFPAVLSDNMVLQQQTNAPLWGKAAPGKIVSVMPEWCKGKFETRADAEGNWKIAVPTPAAGGPYKITVSDGEQTVLDNVLVGEVWFCSGQSNMEMPVKGFRSQPIEGNHDLLIHAEKQTPIRAFTVKRKIASTSQDDCVGTWFENTPENISETSATAYFFAQYLQKVLKVPVGIIVSSWGGTRVEPWMTPAALKDFPQISLSHLGSKDEIKDPQAGSVLYNGMVAPVQPYAIKGAIWYQGESNRNNAALYEQLFPVFVKGLRESWKQGDFPFYYVQIAPYIYNGADSVSGALIREAQMKSLERIPNSGMAVTLDVGELNCIHPAKKKEVGQRLAYWALANDYGKNIFASQGPVFKQMTIDQDKALIEFTSATNGIAPINTDLDFFEIAGADKKFYPAKARLNSKTRLVEVKADEVPQPVAVRYAFKNFTGASVFDTYGLPASSFRTDNW